MSKEEQFLISIFGINMNEFEDLKIPMGLNHALPEINGDNINEVALKITELLNLDKENQTLLLLLARIFKHKKRIAFSEHYYLRLLNLQSFSNRELVDEYLGMKCDELRNENSVSNSLRFDLYQIERIYTCTHILGSRGALERHLQNLVIANMAIMALLLHPLKHLLEISKEK